MSIKVYVLTDPILIDLAQDGDIEGFIIRKTKRATRSERNVPKLKRNDSPSQNEAYL